MSKYAVVKIGSSQEKVSVGDVLTVPANFKIESKTPILMSARKGSLITDEKKLSKYSVNFELLDEKKSKKLNIFTYKNKGTRIFIHIGNNYVYSLNTKCKN